MKLNDYMFTRRKNMMHRWAQFQLFALFVAIISFATYAFASSEGNPLPKRGEGVARISGWDISNVHYRLEENLPQIAAVEFDLDSPAHQVAVSFDLDSSSAFNCHNVSEYHWQCIVDGVEVAQVNSLRVVAVGQ
jgi:hypothetical protein